jgi:hypothetical protein
MEEDTTGTRIPLQKHVNLFPDIEKSRKVSRNISLRNWKIPRDPEGERIRINPFGVYKRLYIYENPVPKVSIGEGIEHE